MNNMNNMNMYLLAGVVLLLVLLWCKNQWPLSHEGFEGDDPVQKLLQDSENNNVYGTTADQFARWENLSVRPEYVGGHGDTHECKCGYPSKRMIDAYGGSNHQLPHMCAPCGKGQCEPAQLGGWWDRFSWHQKEGCGDPSSVGLDRRPHCTRCGN